LDRELDDDPMEPTASQLSKTLLPSE